MEIEWIQTLYSLDTLKHISWLEVRQIRDVEPLMQLSLISSLDSLTIQISRSISGFATALQYIPPVRFFCLSSLQPVALSSTSVSALESLSSVTYVVFCLLRPSLPSSRVCAIPERKLYHLTGKWT